MRFRPKQRGQLRRRRYTKAYEKRLQAAFAHLTGWLESGGYEKAVPEWSASIFADARTRVLSEQRVAALVRINREKTAKPPEEYEEQSLASVEAKLETAKSELVRPNSPPHSAGRGILRPRDSILNMAVVSRWWCWRRWMA